MFIQWVYAWPLKMLYNDDDQSTMQKLCSMKQYDSEAYEANTKKQLHLRLAVQQLK